MSDKPLEQSIFLEALELATPAEHLAKEPAMWFPLLSSLLVQLRSRRPRCNRRGRLRPARYRPRLELLEDRCLLSVAGDFNDLLVADEADVRAFLGDLVTLDDPTDVGRLLLLGEHGFKPSHPPFFSFAGQGLAFADVPFPDDGSDPNPTLGQPLLLLYLPTLTPSLLNPFPSATDLIGDFPYRLNGWAYGFDYDPAAIPELGGIPKDTWIVHEAGYHQLDGGFEPTPPPGENPKGSLDVNTEPAGEPTELSVAWHPRLWDLHIFTDPLGGPPRASILDPFRTIPGIPNGSESFYFPNLPFESTVRTAARIEAEDFDMGRGFGWQDTTTGNGGLEYRLTDVDIRPTSDTSGTFDVSVSPGEFLQYTTNIPTTATYEFSFRMTNRLANPIRFHVDIDGQLAGGPVNVPTTGSNGAYVTFTPFSLNLTQGVHQIKVVFDTNPSGVSGGDFNFLTITRPARPTATLNPFSITSLIATRDFSVTYRDNAAINVSTLDSSDVRVTGPNLFNAPAKLVSRSENRDSGQVTVTYRVAGPGTIWDPGDNGTYSVVMQAKQVLDISGNAVSSGTIGTFSVSVPRATLSVNVNAGVPPQITQLALVVNGTDRAETITFVASSSSAGIHVEVRFNGSAVEVFDVSTFGLNVPLASIPATLVVKANDGGDTVTVSPLPWASTVFGGPGNDVLTGGSNNDELHGGPGNDQLRGGPGAGRLFGEEGDLSATLDSGDLIDLGPGEDGIVFFGTDGDDVITVSRQAGPAGPQVVITMGDQLFVSDYLNGETITVFAGGGNDLVRMDHLAGSAWQARFFGQAGRDLLVGGAQDDLLDGGPGEDILFGGLGADELFVKDGEQDLVFLGRGDRLGDWDRVDVVLRGVSFSHLLDLAWLPLLWR